MMQWYADYLDALKEGITANLRDQFDTRVNQFLARPSAPPLTASHTHKDDHLQKETDSTATQ
ncbi:hypothetical protein D3C81_1898440 [compost metagenome]